MYTLKRAYAEYLETQVPNSEFEKDLSTDRYLCWSIPHEQVYANYNYHGEKLDSVVIRSKRYVWLGKKGSIYVTKTPKFVKKNTSDTSIHHEMKSWVWKKYFNIDFDSEV